mmetsp:Transcript_10545/g.23648  ORF Transcript_10545/g.23648 Transcript_10545/m.23648 type:complete len:160 (+) Transcript_10545:3447-3926(+)
MVNMKPRTATLIASFPRTSSTRRSTSLGDSLRFRLITCSSGSVFWLPLCDMRLDAISSEDGSGGDGIVAVDEAAPSGPVELLSPVVARVTRDVTSRVSVASGQKISAASASSTADDMASSLTGSCRKDVLLRLLRLLLSPMSAVDASDVTGLAGTAGSS